MGYASVAIRKNMVSVIIGRLKRLVFIDIVVNLIAGNPFFSSDEELYRCLRQKRKRRKIVKDEEVRSL